MATISPEKVIDASAYVQDALTDSKRLALMALAAKWRRVDPANVRATMAPLLPEIEQLMHEQQALGRQIAWTQGELAAAVATGEAPGSTPLPLDAAREGRLRGGPPFASALQRAIPGALARIKSGVRPDAAVADAGRMVALQLGSIAHDEARLVTQDLVMARGGGATPRMGYARKPEGAHTCDFCRTLATRGPVYSADTAGFRAHRFCDCTTYAVPMEVFEVDPDDWAAYQRWAARSARSAVTTAGKARTTWQSAERIDLVNAQIASYEPIVRAGNGTDWMRSKLRELYEEQRILSSGRTSHLRPGLVEIPQDVFLDGNWGDAYPYNGMLTEQAYSGTWREAWTNQHFMVKSERTNVYLAFRKDQFPSIEGINDLVDQLDDLMDTVQPDFGFWRPSDWSFFDVQTLTPGTLAATNHSSGRMFINDDVWKLLNPKNAAVVQAHQAMGREWNVASLANSEDYVRALLLHEFGHQVHYPSFDTEFAARVKPLFAKWQFVGVEDDGVHEAILRLVSPRSLDFVDCINLMLNVRGGPTLYGRASEDEMFAEAYATWKMRDRIPNLNPKTLEWAEEFAREFGWS